MRSFSTSYTAYLIKIKSLAELEAFYSVLLKTCAMQSRKGSLGVAFYSSMELRGWVSIIFEFISLSRSPSGIR